MIRTAVVPLTVIPGFAYRQKLRSGGSGIVLLRSDAAQPGIAGISKTSGEPVPAENCPLNLFPIAAFREAIELTKGLAYRNLSGVKLVLSQPAEAPETEEDTLPAERSAADSPEYRIIVSAYSDKSGRLSPELINRDLIRFAHRSSAVRAMISAKESEDSIRLYITGTKFRTVTRNRNLTDGEIAAILSLLDEAVPQGLFRELNLELRRMLAKP